MAILIKVNEAPLLENSVLETTDEADAALSFEIKSWFVGFLQRHPAVTKVECEVV